MSCEHGPPTEFVGPWDGMTDTCHCCGGSNQFLDLDYAAWSRNLCRKCGGKFEAKSVMNEQEANSMAMACLARVALVASMDRLRSTVNAIAGIYEEQAARKQYDILGDGSA